MSAESVAGTALRIGFWLPLVICTYLAFTPSPPEVVSEIGDVFLHGFAFAYLTFALGLAHRLGAWWQKGAWMIAYGLFIELVQSFEPARSAELKDIVVDCVGIGLGLAGFWLAGEWVRSLALQITRSLVRQP